MFSCGLRWRLCRLRRTPVEVFHKFLRRWTVVTIWKNRQTAGSDVKAGGCRPNEAYTKRAVSRMAYDGNGNFGAYEQEH